MSREEEKGLEEILYHKGGTLRKPIEFLDYFPMFDWITNLELLNKTFHTLVKQKCDASTILDLSQLWSLVGDKILVGDDFEDEITSLIKRFPNATNISFGYCHNMTDNSLKMYMTELCQEPGNITELNLFYNNKLKDESMQWVCKRFPNLKKLNVGRCMNLGEKSIDKISNLQHLKKLTLSSTEMGTEALMSLEENECLARLDVLDVSGCKRITREALEASVTKYKGLHVISDVWGKRGRMISKNGS